MGRAIDMRASLAALARGGLPLRATERLQEEAGPHRKLFSSDLGVNEFLFVGYLFALRDGSNGDFLSAIEHCFELVRCAG